jgi:redox-sensitive bicupin YhaK (pirin superfamily)
MRKIVHRADTRKIQDKGWIRTACSLHAEMPTPDQQCFGTLVAINETIMQASCRGLGMHSHSNLELLSLVLSGTLGHEDSTGNRTQFSAGQMQLISCGTGILHNEYNHSETDPLSLLQLWISPATYNIMPRYHHQLLNNINLHNQLHVIAAPVAAKNRLRINQEAYIAIGNLDKGIKIDYSLRRAINGVYFFLLSGQVQLAEETLFSRDAIGLYEFQTVKIHALEKSELLAIQVPVSR